MKSVISIGNQDFISIRKNNCFYIDKTDFIREWWDNQDSVTLITRPRRFGKTLNMSMVEYFFSVNHSECSKYFEDLVIWKEERFRKLQGTYPVISLSRNYQSHRTFSSQYLYSSLISTQWALPRPHSCPSFAQPRNAHKGGAHLQGACNS